MDRDERDEQNLITRRALALRPNQELDIVNTDKLAFAGSCGSHAAVINSGLTAHRPNAEDDFNFGVCLTNRPIKANEVFEVRLDRMVTKWAGSIEIGVTTHAPSDLEFPSTSRKYFIIGSFVVYLFCFSDQCEVGDLDDDRQWCHAQVGNIIRKLGSLFVSFQWHHNN